MRGSFSRWVKKQRPTAPNVFCLAQRAAFVLNRPEPRAGLWIGYFSECFGGQFLIGTGATQFVRAEVLCPWVPAMLTGWTIDDTPPWFDAVDAVTGVRLVGAI